MSAYFEYKYDWPEFVALIFLILGFIVAVIADSAAAAYAVVFLMGLFFGRVWCRFRNASKVPLMMAVIGCLLGLCLGLIMQNLKIVVLLFVLGIFVGFWLHNLGWVKSEEF